MKSNSTINTLTYKLGMYFITFAVLIFIILWFMQVIFLQSYYSSMKKGEIIKLADDIEKEYLKGNYFENIDKIAYKNASSIFIFDKEGNVEYMSSSGGHTLNNKELQIPSRPISVDVEELIEKMKESPNDKIEYTLKVDRLKSEVFVYGKLIAGTDTYMVIVSSIDPIDATTNVLKSQLVYVTIIALIISSIISIFLSRRISSPIQEMTKTANKLAQGNYDIEFKKAGYLEIDELADTLNYATKRLAESDKVRRELIANVSHDLKTPLTMIKAYSEMIRDLSRR